MLGLLIEYLEHQSYPLHKRKKKFAIKDFFSKCSQICGFLRIFTYLLKKSLMENFNFCAVILVTGTYIRFAFSYFVWVFVSNVSAKHTRVCKFLLARDFNKLIHHGEGNRWIDITFDWCNFWALEFQDSLITVNVPLYCYEVFRYFW